MLQFDPSPVGAKLVNEKILMEADDLSFGQWLQHRRLALHLTQQQLGHLAGCAAETIRKLESDMRRPSPDVAALLATALQLPSEEHPAFVHFARGERADAPPLPVMDGVSRARPMHAPTNLPIPATTLIGREQETAAVQDLLMRSDVRLVTLTGPGGVGKTRISLGVATSLRRTFVDGVMFVELAALTDPALVLPTIAQTLGIRESGTNVLLQDTRTYLRDKQLCLVLDNFEQVLAAGLVVADLLQGAARVKVLVTSRAPLRLQGERQVVVEPFAIPGVPVPALSKLSHYDSVRLFIERAQAVKADFVVTNDNAPAVAEICSCLDGLPLAIELAARRIKLLSPDVLLQRLGRRLQMLTGGARDLPERQQTLHAAIEWSYSLLDHSAQRLFRYVAVFVGGWTLDVAEALLVNGGEQPLDVIESLQSLVDNSLVRQRVGPSGQPRFSMLKTINEFAWQALRSADEADNARATHARYFLKVAESVESALGGPLERERMKELVSEYDNLRAALEWSLESAVDPLLALRFGGALWPVWATHGYIGEGRSLLARALNRHADANNLPTPVRAKALFAAGNLAWLQGDYATARALTEESLAIRRTAGDLHGIAASLSNLGIVVRDQGNYTAARVLLEESLTLRRAIGDGRGIGWALHSLGHLASAEGDFATARTYFEESLTLRRATGYTYGIAYSLSSLGTLAYEIGDVTTARARIMESLELGRDLDDPQCVAECLESLAGISGDALLAAQLFGAAATLRDTIGVQRVPAEQRRYERYLADVRAKVDTVTWTAAWAEGQQLTQEAAIALALGEGT